MFNFLVVNCGYFADHNREIREDTPRCLRTMSTNHNNNKIKNLKLMSTALTNISLVFLKYEIPSDLTLNLKHLEGRLEI